MTALTQHWDSLLDWIGLRREKPRQLTYQKQERRKKPRLHMQTALPEEQNLRDVRYSFALIALTAKMARVGKSVRKESVAAFCDIFPMPVDQHDKIAKLFMMAVKDDTPATRYAAEIADLFPRPKYSAFLQDTFQRLCKVAAADGMISPFEERFITKIARYFGITKRDCARIIKSHSTPAPRNPYQVLGVKPSWTLADIKRTYYQQVKTHHPDHVIARSGSEVEIFRAQSKVAELNIAYKTLKREKEAA